jgi:hypothetical protein
MEFLCVEFVAVDENFQNVHSYYSIRIRGTGLRCEAKQGKKSIII